ncbi:MAG: hypothetical protein MUO76_17235 [Anaerolineaceae bacterium]|nr:hypothetical protein [Anaerolineaceae bacterium]
MDSPADTLNYMIAGYTVIFGTLFFYIVSLYVRWQKLRADQTMLKEIEQDKE